MSQPNHPPGEPTKEGGYSKRCGKTGIHNAELEESLVSNDDLISAELGNGRISLGERGSLVQSEHDPFYVVKEDVLIKLEMADDSLERYQHTVENTDTATYAHKEEKKQLRRHVKNVESTLRDLEATVRLVENKRDRFPNIIDAELYERKTFVCTCSDRIKHMKAEINSESIKAKLIADERNKTRHRLGFLGAKSQEMQGDAEFLEESQASAQILLQQQDETLDELDEAVGRVGHMAGNIHEELGHQNKILTDLEDDLADAEEKLGLVMGKLAKMLKTKNKLQLGTILCLSMVVVVLVFIVIYV